VSVREFRAINVGKNEEEKSAGVASLRGQGTPAYPARLRSERARNSSKHFLAQSQKLIENFPDELQKSAQEALLLQGRKDS
jgi:hypothetical protein